MYIQCIHRLLSNCGSATAAGLGGGGTNFNTASTADDASSATVAASYDFGNGLTVSGGLSAAGGDAAGLFTLESHDVYGAQVCLLYTSPSPRDISGSRMPSSA